MTFFNRNRTATKHAQPSIGGMTPGTDVEAKLDQTRQLQVAKLYTSRIWL